MTGALRLPFESFSLALHGWPNRGISTSSPEAFPSGQIGAPSPPTHSAIHALTRATLTPATQVAIARARDRVTRIQDCLRDQGHPGAIISARVVGSDLLVVAHGPTSAHHLLCDLDGNVIPHLHDRHDQVLEHPTRHITFHGENRGDLFIAWL